MTGRVRVLVQQGGGALASPHDIRLVPRRVRREDAAEHTSVVVIVPGRRLEVLGAPAGPQPIERHLRAVTSPCRRSTKLSTGMSRSGRSESRVLSATVP